MVQAAHHYLIFETGNGFCGIAWSSAGITRFQLPAKSADGAQRMLLRRAPGAKPGTPTLEVAEAVAAVKRYFEGKQTDFSRFKLDLGEQDPFFQRIYAVARQVGWGRTSTYGALAKEVGAGPEAARDVGQAMAKKSGSVDHPVPQGIGGRRQDRRFFRARWPGGQDPHACAGRRSRRTSATGTAIFRVLGRRCLLERQIPGFSSLLREASATAGSLQG